MIRFSPGVYSLYNRGASDSFREYWLDNQYYRIAGDSLMTIVVWNNLIMEPVSGSFFNHKIANHPNQINGNVGLFTP